jgi:tRNA threonylcarbamoyladenosine biosynthesis protein TsaB
MKVLGLDASTNLASVAIVENGALVCERVQASSKSLTAAGAPGGANHSAALLLLVDAVLEDQRLGFSDVAIMGVSIGPGSFTGLRVGLSVAKGLVYGSEVPLFGVRTLEAIARRVPCYEKETFVCPFMDARKGQVYAALYHRDANGFTAVMADTLDTPVNVLARVDSLTSADCIFLGEGASIYRDLIEGTMRGRAKLRSENAYPSTASAVARIAEERGRRGHPEPLQTLTPDYLRPPDAVPPKSRL